MSQRPRQRRRDASVGFEGRHNLRASQRLQRFHPARDRRLPGRVTHHDSLRVRRVLPLRFVHAHDRVGRDVGVAVGHVCAFCRRALGGRRRRGPGVSRFVRRRGRRERAGWDVPQLDFSGGYYGGRYRPSWSADAAASRGRRGQPGGPTRARRVVLRIPTPNQGGSFSATEARARAEERIPTI